MSQLTWWEKWRPISNGESGIQHPETGEARSKAVCVSTTLPLPPTPPTQDFHQLAVYYNQQSLQDFALTMADFHLLLYLYKCDVVPLKVASLTGKSQGMCDLVSLPAGRNIGALHLAEGEEHCRPVPMEA